jgi:hypothetical protein
MNSQIRLLHLGLLLAFISPLTALFENPFKHKRREKLASKPPHYQQALVDLKFNIDLPMVPSNTSEDDPEVALANRLEEISEQEESQAESELFFETEATGSIRANVGFVRTSGTRFVLGGRPWYFAGTNAYYAGNAWIMTENEVRIMFAEHASRGVNVMRVFAFSNFNSTPYSIMPRATATANTYNETSLQRLDFMLAVANENNIRLIMVLGNFWPFLGGVQAWVDNVLGLVNNRSRPLENFYVSTTVRNAYKRWVYKIVTRSNTITNKLYRDDPTILAWELLNEPRTSSLYERNRRLTPGR